MEVLINNAGTTATASLAGELTANAVVSEGTLGSANSNPGNGTPYVITFPTKTTYFEINTTRRLAVVEIRIISESVSEETPLTLAQNWSNDFLINTALGCETEDGTLLASAWTNAEVAYNALNSAAQNILKTSNFDSEGDSIEQALARYYFIASKYQFSDFLGIGIVNPLPVHRVNNTPHVLLVSVVATLVGLTLIWTVLFITDKEQKRKQ